MRVRVTKDDRTLRELGIFVGDSYEVLRKKVNKANTSYYVMASIKRREHSQIEEPTIKRQEFRLWGRECEEIDESIVTLRDVIHYYSMGTRFLYKDANETLSGRLEGLNAGFFTCGDDDVGVWYELEIFSEGDFKLILRHMSDMTKEEKEMHRSLCNNVRDIAGKTMRIVDTPASLHYLIRNGFDAFDLIENGYAIDETTLGPPPLSTPKYPIK